MTIEVGGGGAALPQLGVDNNFFSDRLSTTSPLVRVNGIDGSAGLATALSLTGKFSINYLKFTQLLNEVVTIKLTIDGEVKINEEFTIEGFNAYMFGQLSIDTIATVSESYVVNDSLLLEIATATDNNASLEYVIRALS